MTYLLAGLSYRRSPVAALERVALSAEELPGWLDRLALHAGGGVILSTCNRTEIYGWSDSTGSPHTADRTPRRDSRSRRDRTFRIRRSRLHRFWRGRSPASLQGGVRTRFDGNGRGRDLGTGPDRIAGSGRSRDSGATFIATVPRCAPHRTPHQAGDRRRKRPRLRSVYWSAVAQANFRGTI